MGYEFKYTEDNGFQKVHISKKDHNDMFEYRQIKWCDKYEYYLNEDTGQFVMIKLTSFPAKILATVAYPLLILLHGIVNYKEVNTEIYRMWNQKKTGSFSGDDSHKSQQGWNELMSIVKK